MPTGGTFTAGVGSIAQSANLTSVNQSGARGIVDWSSFSIGIGGIVRFNNGNGATLNRVTGGNMSTILGSLISSGSIYLINPKGILFGRGARINTGGDFIASTLDLADSEFMGGKILTFAGDSKALVANLGSICSKNGNVFLIGYDVSNRGTVSAANGDAGVAAGAEVLLNDSSSEQRVFVRAPGGDITNTGRISAAMVEIRARDGNIYALAGNDGGQIAAAGTAKINGQVWLISDGGKSTVTGTVSAQNADVKGGNIETSGHDLDISHANVKTGQGGNWLLDPVDLLIDATAAATIQNSLATTNVTLETSANESSGPGTASAGSGDITVGSNVAWSSNNSLTLSARTGTSM